LEDRFTHFAQRASALAGHFIAFLTAVVIIVVWAVSGPLLDFDDDQVGHKDRPRRAGVERVMGFCPEEYCAILLDVPPSTAGALKR
jgi:hypothetical protein